MPSPSMAASGTEVAPDPRPPITDTQAVGLWKQRQLDRGASQIAGAVDPAVKASEEVHEAVERERATLVSTCWNAQSPQDLEGGARIKVVAAVDVHGHVGSWQVYEIPEVRRPELASCVSAVLSRLTPDLSAPGKGVTASTFLEFP